MSIQGLHHITAICSDAARTEEYYTDTLGLRLMGRAADDATEDRHLYFAAGDGEPGSIIAFIERPGAPAGRDMPDSFHWYWSAGRGEPGTVVTYFERPGQAAVTHGPGQIDHYALAVDNDASLTDWRLRLLAARLPASPIQDRGYFKSFFTQDPDGQAIELATRGPGFSPEKKK